MKVILVELLKGFTSKSPFTLDELTEFIDNNSVEQPDKPRLNNPPFNIHIDEPSECEEKSCGNCMFSISGKCMDAYCVRYSNWQPKPPVVEKETYTNVSQNTDRLTSLEERVKEWEKELVDTDLNIKYLNGKVDNAIKNIEDKFDELDSRLSKLEGQAKEHKHNNHDSLYINKTSKPITEVLENGKKSTLG